MAEEVLYNLVDGVATITLNRPERLNALNAAIYQGLTEAFDQTDRDDNVRAVVVTGAGRAFCAGAGVAFPFARRGIVPDGASSWFLPRIVGISQALEWCLTGRLVSSEEALAAGLVRTVCPVEDVLPLATRLASEIAASAAPVSAVITRHLLWQ